MKKEVFWWIIAVFMCCLIFYFTGTQASTGSHTQQIIEKLTGLSPDKAETINFYFRKATHLTAFGFLGICFFMALKKKAFLAWEITTIYAATDEYHQSFVPGRTASFKDVIIDSCGCIIAILIVRYFQEKRTKKE
ncbi:VanZ family protein [Bacillus sp. FJAT-49736]|uniref:VanZ family protein n=1 Tax=Bacillus sp. FJAT-49736 TaxID=2833582 RepID=UPI001BC9062B|nr:VanZ family protein [Bacillus sp. FJAT-49736]MBS4174547.1 VanZ family protein [Bacillus sp. FJAT-49736]